MSESFDLIVRGGTLVDGTGAPAVRGDVGVRGGRIAALGENLGSADHVIDAESAVVAPGFAQVLPTVPAVVEAPVYCLHTLPFRAYALKESN